MLHDVSTVGNGSGVVRVFVADIHSYVHMIT